MTNFKKTNTFPAAPHSAAIDFVLSDSVALASHMSICASGQSRFFNLYAALDSGHALLCTRVVTCALVVAVVVGMLGLVGID